jgi:ATP-binding cassette, subfamily B (MDR/TAP), member 1
MSSKIRSVPGISEKADEPVPNPHALHETEVVPPASALAVADSEVLQAAHQETSDPFQNLPEHEASILRRQVTSPVVKASIGTLFRYASTNDLIIIFISSIFAIASGAALPLMTVIFGNLQGAFQDYFLNLSTYDSFMSQTSNLVLYFVYLAIGEFATSYIAMVGFVYTGEHISSKIRQQYLESCMRQNIAFFDKLGAGEVTTRITADANLIQDGISEKLGLILTAIATFVSAFVIGFIMYWKLTLILFSTVVALVLITGTGSRFMLKYNMRAIDSYAVGGSVAEEVLSSIRTAVAFGTQARQAERYDQYLALAETNGFKVRVAVSSIMACMVSFFRWHFVYLSEASLLSGYFSAFCPTSIILFSYFNSHVLLRVL